MKFNCTIIAVEDVIRSRKLYENLLGQKLTADFGEYNASFEGGFALYKKGLYRDLLGGPDIAPAGNNFELYFESDDAAGDEKKIAANGFAFVHRTREEPWRQLVFRFYDYDKNIVCVAENMDITISRLNRNGLSMEEIAKATGMPVGQIEQALDRIDKRSDG